MPFPENVGARRQRAWILVAVVAVMLLLLGARLFYLQVVLGGKYAELARENMVRSEPIPALRGRIFDREGRLLAGNRVSFDLSLEAGHPAYRKRDRLLEAVSEVAGILGKGVEDLHQRALRQRRMFEPLLLARDLDAAALAPFVERMHPIAGITIGQSPLRWNPLGPVGAHVLGHVGEISEEELRRIDDWPYRRGVLVGRSGLEAQYEQILRGADGETYVEVDALGRKIDLFPDLPPRPPVPGADLHLTLDARLQAIAEETLGAVRPEGARSDSAGAPAEMPVRGAAVALDPWTGEVLVCASVPGFDPNDFAHGLSPEQWAALNDPSHPLLNRVSQAAYPPGSIFKIVTTLAGLSEGVMTEETLFDPCYGEYRFGNRTFGCWKEQGHGRLNLLHAFEQSCDIYYYQVARAMGLRRFLAFAGGLELGRVTGIDLPEEREGIMPTMEWYRRRLGGQPPEGNALNLAIGQGEIVLTPLELATFVGAVVSDGAVRRPHLARRAVSRDGTVLWEREEPEVLRQLDLSPERRELIAALLEAVVEGVHGTAQRARVRGFRVGGKTGTAQNPHGDDHALFVGVAPMDAPRIVVLVVAEEAGHGGAVAAPVAQKILEGFLQAAPDGISKDLRPRPPVPTPARERS